MTKIRTTGKPKATIMLITPELAELWLQKNRTNRPLRKSTVSLYAAEITSNRWRFTAETIAFDENGDLYDGQHRLAAIVEAQKPIKAWVITGQPRDSFLCVDIGLNRTCTDMANLAGLEMNTLDAAVTNKFLIGFRGVRGRRTSRASKTKIIEVFQKYQEAIRFAINGVKNSKTDMPIKGIKRADVLAVVARAYLNHDRSKLERFLKALSTGIMKSGADTPAILLRNYLIGTIQRLGANSSTSKEVYAKATNALNAYLNGIKMEKLTAAKEELFPINL